MLPLAATLVLSENSLSRLGKDMVQHRSLEGLSLDGEGRAPAAPPVFGMLCQLRDAAASKNVCLRGGWL